MKKLNQLLLLAVFLFAWSISAGAQERTVELVKDGQVVFSLPASELEYMTVVNRLPVPKNVRGAADNGKITITWDAVTNATSYKIFRSADGNAFSLVGTSSSNSFTDNSPLSGSNYYRVQALGANDAQSGMSTMTQSVTSNVQGESGIYLGLMGFNQKLTHYPISQLTEESKQDYYNFIDAFNSDNDGTALYYAVDQAISTLQSKSYPADLNSVHVVTFTDGIDNYSLDIYDEIEFGRYSDPDECGDYVKSRLANEKVSGLKITGWAVGLRHKDVNSQRFAATLDRIASLKYYEFDDMSAVEAQFKEIAKNITEVNKTQNITVSISGGLKDGERVRFTFDLPKSSTSLTGSSLYIEGTYQRTSATTRKLTNITANGLTLKGTEVVGTKNAETGLFDFTFKEVATNNKKLIDTNNTLEWWGNPWQKDTEFNPDINTKTEVLSHSAAIILVLDCTKSLGTKFAEMQKSAKSFIATLLDQTYSDTSGDEPGSDSNYNGHEYVDLGLPSGLKWATCNVGASSPSDYGYYYAWGETTPKGTYTENNSTTYGKSMGDISGNSEYDAARANWGGSWRLPSQMECVELRDLCTWTWTSQGGYNGYKVTGPNGNSIFLPAAGWRSGSSLHGAGDRGYCWSSTPYESDTQRACSLYFSSSYHNVDWNRRYFGQSVRPVSD
ncbi:MAG: hypothetical protein K2G91_07005 [Prevotella sp.]|nr:hypothetical protein [Prevotella sp.]